MKWMIASDIHGSDTHCARLMAALEREKPERLILLGDLLYHGPRNDLPEGYAPKRVIERLNAARDKLLCVRGNCDTEVDQMVLDFPILADYAVLGLADRLIYLSHGHVCGPDHPPRLNARDILLTGHTHVPAWTHAEGRLCLNPGSVSIPKNGTAHSYMTLEDGAFCWKDLEGNPYHSLKL